MPCQDLGHQHRSLLSPVFSPQDVAVVAFQLLLLLCT